MSRAPARRKGGELELLAAIFTDLPARPNALCIGKYDIFDAASDGDLDAIRTASWLCRRCPHAADCPDSTTEQEPADALAY